MNWREGVQLELQRAAEADRNANLGKARTSSRRAVGIAVTELQRRLPEKHFGRDFIGQLRGIAADESIPATVRFAAERLQTRLSTDFESPSKHPIEDAKIIIDFVIERLR
ncbi:MAG: hypothetical protein Q8P51_02245 [Ignavibacteria bacterium]|nr:hypothetical protein [Ignavibacteria bacterium]